MYTKLVGAYPAYLCTEPVGVCMPTESVGVYESTELVGVYTVDLPTKPV